VVLSILYSTYLVGFVVASGGGGRLGSESPHPTPSQVPHSYNSKIYMPFFPPPDFTSLHFPLPCTPLSSIVSTQPSVGPPFLAPHPTSSTGTHPVSQRGIHTSKCCTLAGGHTDLPLPIAPYLSQRPIIVASSHEWPQVRWLHLCSPPPPTPRTPPRVRRRSHQSLTWAATPDSHCVTHPRVIVPRCAWLAGGG
jgi:hypothetical protein